LELKKEKYLKVKTHMASSMKKFLPLGLVLLAGVLLATLVYAIPNPAPIYCTEMGYATEMGSADENEYCVFDDGGMCEIQDFYTGACGQEYVKELPCTKSGESNLPGHECCEGLVPVPPSNVSADNTCNLITGWSMCAPCGNGVCDSEVENKCNCPEDCKETCAETDRNVYIDSSFGRPTYCCSKNDGIKPATRLVYTQCSTPYGGLKGKCTANWWKTCGDGICNQQEEDRCSCPEDCKECTPEGQSYAVIPGTKPCCEGLNTLTSNLSPQTGECQTIEGVAHCENCGNGICSGFEDKCNCPQDCGTEGPCTDSDGGKDYYTMGQVKSDSGLLNDHCVYGLAAASTRVLIEGYCLNGERTGIEYICPTECKNGACVEENLSCAQSGGKVYYKEKFGPTYCCSENDGVKLIASLIGGDCAPAPNGAKGICTEGWWRTCGDGTCSNEEDECNCPKDCGKENQCKDSELRVDYYVEGQVRDNRGMLSDYCIYNSNVLIEGYCLDEPNAAGGMIAHERYDCPNGCNDGICLGEPCVCPAVWDPVCGVDGKTYSNKCVAECANVEVAYGGECGSEAINVEIGEKFELVERQRAILLEDGTATGIELRLLNIYYYGIGIEPSVRMEASKREGNTAAGTVITISQGRSAKVFGITISCLEIVSAEPFNLAVFKTEKESVPDYVEAGLGEKFNLLEDQVAYIPKRKDSLLKIHFDGLIQTRCLEEQPAVTSVSTIESTAATASISITPSSGGGGGDTRCGAPYAQLQVSIAAGGMHYLNLRQGQTRKVGNYEISLLRLYRAGKRYSATLVVKKTSDHDTKVVNLDKPFDLFESQKAIVKETRLQLKLVELSEVAEFSGKVAVLEVLQPVYIAEVSESNRNREGTGANTTALTAQYEEGEIKRVIESVETEIEKPNRIVYRPYIRLAIGQSEDVFGHTIKLNDISTLVCAQDGLGCGESIANLTVSKRQEPPAKKVFLNETFDLVEEQKAIVFDRDQDDPRERLPQKVMGIKLIGISSAVSGPANDTKEEGMTDYEEGEVAYDTRQSVKVSVELPAECSENDTGGSCVASSTIMVLREGDERGIGKYTLRLLDIAKNRAWFIVKKGISDIKKVYLNEKFDLRQRQSAFVVEENLFIRLNETRLGIVCSQEESGCIGGNYAKVKIWKGRGSMPEYIIREGETLKLYGVKVTLLELGNGKALFIVEKGTSSVINVHLDEPFTLNERQAARVLEANMRIDLLGIVNGVCDDNNSGVCYPSKVDISVSNYLFSKELTGKAVESKDYIESVIEKADDSGSIRSTETDSGTLPAPPTPVPPVPFRTFTLAAGESAVVNDFVIKVLSIGYNGAEFIVKRAGSGQEMTIVLYNGWNLFSIPGDIEAIEDSGCKANNIRVFEYIEEEGEFVKATGDKKGQAYWMHNPGGMCTVKAIVREPVRLHEIDKVIEGWNFVPILVDMIGSTVRELASKCAPEAAYFYDGEGKQWWDAMDAKITERDLGKAFAIYATERCSIGVGAEIPKIPMLPDLPDIGG